ncbi:MAG: DNA polymerase III subunit delta [Lentisphaerae bacterium]|nr:DNA polymerase III subunit delta [Lentisphaerota bacterium]
MGKFYLVSGDDDFARKRCARETAAMLCGSDDPESADCMEVIPGDLPELKPEELAGRFIEALRTPPFLCPQKVVWMRHHPDLDYFATGAAGAVELAEVLSSPLPDDIAVLIDGPGLDKRKTVFKNWVKAGAAVEIFTIAKSTDRNFAETRRGVLNEFTRKSGKRLRPDAMQYLTEVIGGDSGNLASELEKLLCFAGDAPEITLADCRTIVSRTPEAVIWEYTDAIQRRDRTAALQMLETLNAQNEPGLELKLIAMLSNSFQKQLNTKMAMQELNITRVNPATFDHIPEDLRAQYPDNPLLKLHPYRAFKMCESAARLSGGEAAQKLTLIRNTSRALVSGGGTPRILLEQLTIKLTS